MTSPALARRIGASGREHGHAVPTSRPPRRRRRGTRVGGIPIVALLVLAHCALPPDEMTWAAVEARIREAFPDVPSLDTTALSDLMQDPTRPVVLIDVREPEEYAVSHLPGAVRARSMEHAATLAADAPAGATVVAYCSVGYRSAHLVAELQDRGLTGVHNLEGSIFRWANEDRQLYRGDVPVREVHPFDEAWGVLLQADRRAWSP